MKALGPILAVLLIGVLVASSALFTVNQAQQALVLQFGAPVRVVKDPGLKWKIPFVQNVVYFDKRLLDFDADAQEVIMADQKRLVVDAFARYRIVDPLQFFQSIGTESNMRARLSAIVNSSLRNVLGSVPFSAVLTARRGDLMHQMKQSVETESKATSSAPIRRARKQLSTLR